MKKLFALFAFLIVFTSCAQQQETASVAINEKSALADFKGKPSVVLFAGTYCPHCQEALPEYKSKVYDAYKDKANLWVNVIDQKKFDVKVAQGFNPTLTFEALSGKKCAYVPAFIVLDEKAFPAMTSCGGEKTIDDMKKEIDTLLK